MTDERPSWRPTRRRLTESLRAALAPVAACALALGALTAWTGSGAAGSPARIEVERGRAFLPLGDVRDTAVFFRIVNSGGADDQLTAVTSPDADGAMLSRTRAAGTNAATMRMVDSVTVPARKALTMSPSGLDIMATPRTRWQAGDTVRFVLHFRHSGPIEAQAVVVRPGG